MDEQKTNEQYATSVMAREKDSSEDELFDWLDLWNKTNTKAKAFQAFPKTYAMGTKLRSRTFHLFFHTAHPLLLLTPPQARSFTRPYSRSHVETLRLGKARKRLLPAG